MPRWDPSPIWQGQDAYIVGGGPSLRQFDWDLIRGKNTIGCNSAFVLGSQIVKINLFADLKWWNKIGSTDGSRFGGLMVGCHPQLVNQTECEWLLTMDRTDGPGLCKPGERRLSFNGNTGALAINLALVLGARRVFLLGFDMKMDSQAKPNWHEIRCEEAYAEVYTRFMRFMIKIVRDLPRKFPGCEIVNVTNDSMLELFPKVTLEQHFKKGEKK